MNSSSTPSKPTISGDVFDALPESIRVYIRYLETRIHELETRLSKNSSNSGKPPSSDGLKRKPKSLRGRTDKKPGGQKGRVGKGLAQAQNPDVIVTHAPVNCDSCGSNLDGVNGSCVEKRQVFDIPQPRVEITEHQIEEKQCPCCGCTNRAVFPDTIRGPAQYGERVQALAAYFSHQHFIPADRLCQIFEDVFGVPISAGTCSNIDDKLFRNLESFESTLKAYLLAARVLHFDESGIRCEKKLHWVHVASSQMATLYTIHTKRGQEAMDAAGILPDFKGFAVHDHWYPYFSYKAIHALCNAHHLRELTFVHEQEREEWAKRMKDLLISGKEEAEKYRETGTLPAGIVRQIERSYDEIIEEGLRYHDLLSPLSQGNRGKSKQRPGKNLLDRLREKRVSVLWFINCLVVPFTNNQGEQDIRMVKLKQKIAGCFRTLVGGQIFCRIRSYISTARKQGWNIWDALTEAIRGSPRQLAIDQALEIGISVA